MDRFFGDSLGEVATTFANLSLKKRDILVGTLDERSFRPQKSSLLFAPLIKEGLFGDSLLTGLAADLSVGGHHDNVTSFTRSLRPFLEKKKPSATSSAGES